MVKYIQTFYKHRLFANILRNTVGRGKNQCACLPQETTKLTTLLQMTSSKTLTCASVLRGKSILLRIQSWWFLM